MSLYSYEVSLASITCQFRKQDAYYVLQGLGVETRDTAWVWLKVKYVLRYIYWKVEFIKFVLVSTYNLKLLDLYGCYKYGIPIGILDETTHLTFWCLLLYQSFEILACQTSPRILSSMESWKHPGGIFIKELIFCSVFMQFCDNKILRLHQLSFMDTLKIS